MSEDNVEVYHYKQGSEWIAIFFNNDKDVGREWNKLCQELMLQNAVPNRLSYLIFLEDMAKKGYFPPVEGLN